MILLGFYSGYSDPSVLKCLSRLAAQRKKKKKKKSLPQVHSRAPCRGELSINPKKEKEDGLGKKACLTQQ